MEEQFYVRASYLIEEKASEFTGYGNGIYFAGHRFVPELISSTEWISLEQKKTYAIGFSDLCEIQLPGFLKGAYAKHQHVPENSSIDFFIEKNSLLVRPEGTKNQCSIYTSELPREDLAEPVGFEDEVKVPLSDSYMTHVGFFNVGLLNRSGFARLDISPAWLIPGKTALHYAGFKDPNQGGNLRDHYAGLLDTEIN